MFNDKLVVRGGYGLNYNQEEIAISSNIVNNPGLVIFPSFNYVHTDLAKSGDYLRNGRFT